MISTIFSVVLIAGFFASPAVAGSKCEFRFFRQIAVQDGQLERKAIDTLSGNLLRWNCRYLFSDVPDAKSVDHFLVCRDLRNDGRARTRAVQDLIFAFKGRIRPLGCDRAWKTAAEGWSPSDVAREVTLIRLLGLPGETDTRDFLRVSYVCSEGAPPEERTGNVGLMINSEFGGWVVEDAGNVIPDLPCEGRDPDLR